MMPTFATNHNVHVNMCLLIVIAAVVAVVGVYIKIWRNSLTLIMGHTFVGNICVNLRLCIYVPFVDVL